VKKVSRRTPLFLVSFLVIVGSTCGVQRAQADPVDMFTGSWNPYFGSSPVAADQSIAGSFGSTFDGELGSNPVAVCTGGPCPPALPTQLEGSDSWSGTFDGGSLGILFSFGAEFEATITGGSFSGARTWSFDTDENYGGNQQMLSFTGTWFTIDPITGGLSPNGWRSDGTLTDSIGWEIGGGYSQSGTITLTTYTTPEPAGMTFLGLGMVAVGFLRHRLTNSSLQALRQNGAADTKQRTHSDVQPS
jgi:hypothetical protein